MLTTEQTASMLGVTTRTLRSYRRMLEAHYGRSFTLKPGRRRFYDPKYLHLFRTLKDHAVLPASPDDLTVLMTLAFGDTAS
jgi:DNA-binding transcriptional MerR regulator